MTQKNDANRPTTKQKSPKEVHPIPQSRLRFMSFSVGIGTSVFSAPSDTPTFASMRTACCPFPPTPSIVASPILKESASAAETVSSFSIHCQLPSIQVREFMCLFEVDAVEVCGLFFPQAAWCMHGYGEFPARMLNECLCGFHCSAPFIYHSPTL